MVRMVERCARGARRFCEQFNVEDKERRACDRADCGGHEAPCRVSAVCALALCVWRCKERWTGRGANEARPQPDNGRAVPASAAQKMPPQPWRV
jgi:hypothetical protein